MSSILVENSIMQRRTFLATLGTVAASRSAQAKVGNIEFGGCASADHFDTAVDAFLRYGKGRHPAGLNFGDCLVYAASRVSGVPLLFTGNDFSKTDIAEV